VHGSSPYESYELGLSRYVMKLRRGEEIKVLLLFNCSFLYSKSG